jgi:hypothetical protein
MREVATFVFVVSAILAICMGAGPTDFRGGAITMALVAATFAAVREAFR